MPAKPPEDRPRKRTELERLVEEDGVTLQAGVRTIAVRQVGVLLAAIDRETTRMESEPTLDTVTGLRICRMLRQLVPLIEMRDQDAAARLAASAAPRTKPQSLAARIANRTPDVDTVATNGHGNTTA
jgi:hypothetical protein